MADVMAAIISRPRRHTQGRGVTPAPMSADAHLSQTLIGLSHSDGLEIAPLRDPAAGSVMGGSTASPPDASLHHVRATSPTGCSWPATERDPGASAGSFLREMGIL